MKNKITRTLTAFCAALLLMGGVSVPAFAQTPEETPDATDDSGVVVEEPQEAEPITPKGNATLVDDFGGNKQLITVTTKAGNYFYILIDRDDEGENTVHFLNQVDDADLSALLEDGETEETPAVCTCTEKCEAGAVNINCPVCSTDCTQCAGVEAEPEPEEPEEPQEKESGGNMGLLLIVLVLAGAGGAAFYYFKVLKPKKDAAKGSDDLSDYDFDDYDEDEETEEEQPEEPDGGEETDEGQEDKEV